MGREIVTTTNSTELPLIMADFETYNLGDFQLKSGGAIPNTTSRTRLMETPNLQLSYTPPGIQAVCNIATCTNSTMTSHMQPFRTTSGLLERTSLLVQNITSSSHQPYFGNCESSSPSNTPPHPFPDVLFHDNIHTQHELVTKHLGIQHAFAILGWSMGGCQAY